MNNLKIIYDSEKLNSTAVTDYLKKKLGKLTKFNKEANILAKIKKEKDTYKVSVDLVFDNKPSKMNFFQSETNKDLYEAIDKIDSKLTRQVRRNKTKNLSRRRDNTLLGANSAKVSATKNINTLKKFYEKTI